MTAPRCGQPTASGRPCRRTLIPFGPRMICPTHIRPPAQLVCPHPGQPHTEQGEPPRQWRDRSNGGAA